MKKRGLLTLPVLLVAVLALALGSVGTAAAGGITKAQVKKIATKVVKKKAKTLSVAHAASADTATTAANSSNSGLLGGLAANQLGRATTATAGTAGEICSQALLSNFTSATFTTLVSKSVTAPTAGVIMVIGTATSEVDNSNSPAGSGLNLNGRLTVDGVQSGVQSQINLNEDSAAPCGDAATLTVQSVAPVAAGTHTVAVQVARYAGSDAAAWIGNAAVSAVFVPFGNGGVQGQPGATHSSGQSASGSNAR